MWLSSYIATGCFLFCLGIYEASHVLEKEIDKVFLAKYRLFESPKKTLKKFCSEEKKEENPFWSCRVSYTWRTRDKMWEDVCAQVHNPHLYAPRYYRLALQCRVLKQDVKGLRSEWEVYY